MYPRDACLARGKLGESLSTGRVASPASAARIAAGLRRGGLRSSSEDPLASLQAPVKGSRGVRLAIEVTHYAGRSELPVVTLTRVA
jgi:hypothetical protein